MTRLILAAGVAALAIAGPASAKPGGNGGGHGGGNAAAFNGGGGERHGGGNAQSAGGFERHGRGGGGGDAIRAERHGGGQRQFAFDRGHGGGQGGQSMVRAERGQQRHVERAIRPQQMERRQARGFEHRQMRDQRIEQARNWGRDRRDQRLAERAGRPLGARDWTDDHDRFADARGRGLIDGCPPGLWKKDNGCLPPGQANKLLGQRISAAERISALTGLPVGLRSFYPDTNDYYYRYGDGYLYRVDRTSSLINSVLPLITGGYLPGQMFPGAYMNNYAAGSNFPSWYGNNYVPDNYGWNSFYPDSPGIDYRYLNGNVYGVDPYSGMIQNVIPTYAYGYGVGQMLPSGYGYYNVPDQYRSLYYNTPDNNYWYAPGAIYQVDPSTSLITSVASLLAPGLSVGQALPMGYDYYNVPSAYRSTYYDTPDAWYRYNNGNIYQVDPKTRLITAIVQALLT